LTADYSIKGTDQGKGAQDEEGMDKGTDQGKGAQDEEGMEAVA
jgi:hypothetical protein